MAAEKEPEQHNAARKFQGPGGVGLLFFDGRSIAGWVLAGGGAVIIFVGILANLQIFFTPTTLFNVILMLTMFAAGLGLMARAVKSF